MVCHSIYDGNHLQQVLDRATGKRHCQTAKRLSKHFHSHGPHSSPKEGHLHVQQQHRRRGCGIFTASVTWPLVVKQSIHGTLCKDGSSMVSHWDPCVELAKKVSVFLVEALKPWQALRLSLQHPGRMSPGTATGCCPRNLGGGRWGGKRPSAQWALWQSNMAGKIHRKSIENPSNMGIFQQTMWELLIPLSRKLVNFGTTSLGRGDAFDHHFLIFQLYTLSVDQSMSWDILIHKSFAKSVNQWGWVIDMNK